MPKLWRFRAPAKNWASNFWTIAIYTSRWNRAPCAPRRYHWRASEMFTMRPRISRVAVSPTTHACTIQTNICFAHMYHSCLNTQTPRPHYYGNFLHYVANKKTANNRRFSLLILSTNARSFVPVAAIPSNAVWSVRYPPNRRPAQHAMYSTQQ